MTPGFLRPAAAGRSPFSAVRKALKLMVPEEVACPPEAGPQDIAYLYRGYAPLSIRLVEAAIKTGWGAIAEALGALPGPHFDIVQTLDAHGLPTERPFRASAAAAAGGAAGDGAAAGTGGGGGAGPGAAADGSFGHGPGAGGGAGISSTAQPSSSAAGSSGAGDARGEVIVVGFIGGVTFAEISALRFLSSCPDCPHKFLILTTKIVNGRTLLQSFIDPVSLKVSSAIGLQG